MTEDDETAKSRRGDGGWGGGGVITPVRRSGDLLTHCQLRVGSILGKLLRVKPEQLVN